MGKTRTLVKFCEWVLGRDNTNKIIAGAYSDAAAVDISRFTRNAILEEKQKEEQVIFSDIFPDTKIKKDDHSMSRWSLEGYFFNFLSAGLGGAVTGKGCNIGICDDLIRGADIAVSKSALKKIWLWYDATFQSRIETGGKIILCGTPWSKHDPQGVILNSELAEDYYVLSMPECSNGQVLCESLRTKEEYENRRKGASLSPITYAIFKANYDLECIDSTSQLYKNIRKYSKAPEEGRKICFIDTADTGDNYFAGIAGIEDNIQKEGYITDIFYSQSEIEKIDRELCEFIIRNKIDYCLFEQNNGGRVIAVSVDNLLKKEYNHHTTVVDWFHQSENKKARIYSKAGNVMRKIFFPEGWEHRYPDAYDHLSTFDTQLKSDFDDFPDALTGFYEMIVEFDREPETLQEW